MDITTPPSAIEVRSLLESLTMRQLQRLADLSGVPVPTIHKIRYGVTVNPGIETVRKLLTHIDGASAQAAEAA